MSLYLQQLRGLSPLAIGAAFVPMMLVGTAVTPFSARLAEKLGARVLISADLVLMATGLLILGVLGAGLGAGRAVQRPPHGPVSAERPGRTGAAAAGRRGQGAGWRTLRTQTDTDCTDLGEAIEIASKHPTA
jgi:hypothetical protein